MNCKSVGGGHQKSENDCNGFEGKISISRIRGRGYGIIGKMGGW